MTTMFASLLRAMTRVAVRMGLRRPGRRKAAVAGDPLPEKQALQCPVCGDRHSLSPR